MLAEPATEYFDGVYVFKLKQGKLTDIGYIDLAAGPADTVEQQSLLPMMNILEKSATIFIYFDGPVTYLDDAGIAHTLKLGEIEYRGAESQEQICR